MMLKEKKKLRQKQWSIKYVSVWQVVYCLIKWIRIVKLDPGNKVNLLKVQR